MKAKFKNTKTNNEVQINSIHHLHIDDKILRAYLLDDTKIWERDCFLANHEWVEGDEWLREVLLDLYSNYAIIRNA